MKKLAASILIFAATIVITVEVGAADRSPLPKKQLAVNIVRLVNTAELAHSHKSGEFVEWKTLRASETFAETLKRLAPIYKLEGIQFAEAPEITPGLKLKLALSNDRKAYLFTVVESGEEPCSIGFVSDESGLIRETRALGCSK